jgi:hypothetical protein
MVCTCIAAAMVCTAIRLADARSAPLPPSTDAPCSPAVSAQPDIERRRPGAPTPPATPSVDCDSDRLPRVKSEELQEPVAVPDRWRLVEELGYRVDWLDSYRGYNPMKADRPVFGEDFLNLSAVAGTLIEDRRIPSTAMGVPDAQGERTATHNQLFFNQSLSLDAVLYRGDTVFRPPDWQWRFTTVLSASGTHTDGKTTSADTDAVQALWFEKHLRDVSSHDDFDSARIGIQSLTSDFRGFLLSDQPVAARLFGTRDNNIFQYNAAWFRSFRKNSVSLNDITAGLPRNDVLLANLYWQDFPRAGLTSEFVGAYNRNREPGMQELLGLGTANAPAARAKHDYDVGYFGYGIDGHLGRLNATAMTYGLLGNEKQATFNAGSARVQSWFAASEWSVDFDRRRWRLSLLHASGDDNPHDRRATGFDGLTANPVFAGTDSSFFIHQQLALAGGVFNLKSRNALLPTLSPTSNSGQSNFSNPGLDLVGFGLDWDVAPQWRLSFDANQLWLDQTAVLAALMLRPIPSNLGAELAVNAFWRPFSNQNVILRMSNAMLMRGAGYRALYDGGVPYSTFVFLTLSY